MASLIECQNVEERLMELNARHAQLETAFSIVRNPEDWRAPIDANVRLQDLSIVLEAIIYFTATRPEVIRTARADVYRVKSEGYRNGPAGP